MASQRSSKSSCEAAQMRVSAGKIGTRQIMRNGFSDLLLSLELECIGGNFGILGHPQLLV
jgi:hypothetical protein